MSVERRARRGVKKKQLKVTGKIEKPAHPQAEVLSLALEAIGIYDEFVPRAKEMLASLGKVSTFINSGREGSKALKINIGETVEELTEEMASTIDTMDEAFLGLRDYRDKYGKTPLKINSEDGMNAGTNMNIIYSGKGVLISAHSTWALKVEDVLTKASMK